VSGFELLRYAGGALRGHRLRSGLSLLGVAIGVASVIVLTSLGEGARLYVSGEFSTLGTNLLIVLPGKSETTGGPPIFGGVANDLTLGDAEAIRRRVRQVRRVAPLSMGEATASRGTIAREITVMGTTAELKPVRKIEMLLGRYLAGGTAHEGQRLCVLGATVRQELFPDTNPLGESLRLGDERYRVIGVLAPRGRSLGMDLDDMVHVPVRSAMRMFNRVGLFQMLVEVNTHTDIEAAKRGVTDVIAERHHGEDDITILTQDAVLSTFDNIMVALTAALGGIAAISLSVAGIGIMNVMLVSVSERTSEVGLLKALGASRGQILLVFLIEAAVLSCTGGAIGLATGLLFDRVFMAVYPAFPVQPPLWAVGFAVTLSASVGVIFGALPARRAAGLDPVVALTRR
jgi:putative ABC transport system permease protein